MKRLVIVVAALAAASCSPRKYAITQLGNALAGSGTSYGSDNDPELIRGAIPFSLKLIESVLEETPKHEGLLLAASRGFAQYAYAFVMEDADEMEAKDRAGAQATRARAAKLFLRARDFGMRGIEVKHPNFGQALKADPKAAVAKLTAKEVPFLYWTALSWAGALVSSRDMFMLPEIPRFEAMLDRALELDESYDHGALHGFMITFEMTSPTRKGDKIARAKQHYERAVELSKGQQVGPYLSYAEGIATAEKDRAAFDENIKKALAVNVNAAPEYRLANLVMQRRARWLQSRAGEMFK